MIEIALERVDLAKYFQEIFCYTEIGHRKDHPAFWLAVEQRIAVHLRHIAMIGDSYEQDAEAPRRFGVQAVWFNPAGSPVTGGNSVPDVRSLKTFASWVASAA